MKIRTFIFILCAAIVSVLIVRVNVKYPNSKICKINKGETVEFNSLLYKIEESNFYTKEQTLEYWPNETFDDYYGYYIKIEIENIGSENHKIELSDFQLVSDIAFTQAVDLQVFLDINDKNIREKMTLKKGDSVTCILPFLIVKNNFTAHQWENLKNEKYRLVLSLYPSKIELML